MKKLLLTVLFVLIASLAWGASMTCDPQAGITKYRVNIPSEGIVDEESMAQPDGSALHNIDGWPDGTYSGAIEAGSEFVLDGTPQGIWEWSPPTPFDLTKPGPLQPNVKAIVP